MKQPVIKWEHFPTRVPAYQIVLLWLVFKQWPQPQWFWGMFWTIMIVWCLGTIYNITKQRTSTPLYREDLKAGSNALFFSEGETK